MKVAFKELLTTAARLTSANPIVRAAAVAAVRLGLRAAFYRASRPGILNKRCMGLPKRFATGLVAMGLSI